MAGRRGRRATPNEPNPFVEPVAWLVSTVGALAAMWYGYPGFVLTLIALLVIAFSKQAPELTGKKDSRGYPTAAHAGETEAMLKYRFWSGLQTDLFFPNDGKFGWPSVTFIASLGAAVAAYGVAQEFWWTAPINAAAIFLVLMGWRTSKRKNTFEGDVEPGVRLNTFPYLNPLAYLLAMIGFALLWVLPWVVRKFRLGRLQDITPGMDKAHPHLEASHADWMLIACGLGAMGAVVFASLLWKSRALKQWRATAEKRVEWNEIWERAGMKMEKPPRLIDYKLFDNGVEHCTFQLQTTELLPVGMFDIGVIGKVIPSLPPSSDIVFLDSPNFNSQGQPQPGTSHPSRFESVMWLENTQPDVGSMRYDSLSDDDKLLYELMVRSSMMKCTMITGYSRSILAKVVDLTLEQGDIEAQPESEELGSDPLKMVSGWGEDREEPEPEEPKKPKGPGPLKRFLNRLSSLWNWRPPQEDPAPQGGFSAALVVALTDGMDMKMTRDSMADLSGYLGCEVLVDYRNEQQQCIIIGHTEGVNWNGTFGIDEKHINNLITSEMWMGHWSASLKQDTNAPTLQSSLSSVDKVGRATVSSQAFTLLKGDLLKKEYMNDEVELRLVNTIQDAMWVSVQGWLSTDPHRRGVRQEFAFKVVWSTDPMPANPARVARSKKDGSLEMLNAMVQRAFRDCRLERPEVYKARLVSDEGRRMSSKSRFNRNPRTAPQDGNLWELSVRLHDGVTFSDVRNAYNRLKEKLGVEWLRLSSDTVDGVSLWVGADPSRDDVSVVNERDRTRIVELDWDQAWVESGVAKHGVAPALLSSSTLPNIPLDADGEPDLKRQVFVLDFEVPAGLSVSEIQDKKYRERLKATTKNDFLSIVPGEEPGVMRVKCAVKDPMPFPVDFDFDFDFSKGIPVGSLVDGSVALYNSSSAVHLMVAGTSGGGKSAAAQTILTGAILSGAETIIIDQVKGGADFVYARPWTIGWAESVSEAAAMVKAVYAEVRRRVEINKTYGLSNVMEAPEEIRPKKWYVFIDEFAGLIEKVKRPPSKAEDNEDLERERLAAKQHYEDVETIRGLTQKIAAEARSAEIHLVVMTQKLSAQMLDGMSNLKNNLARMLLGKASWGDKASALREPSDAPELGDNIPPGRGVFEPLASPAEALQVWFQKPEFHTEVLEARIEKPGWTIDVKPFAPKEQTVAWEVIDSEEDEGGFEVISDEPPEGESLDLTLGDLSEYMELSLEDLGEESTDNGEESAEEDGAFAFSLDDDDSTDDAAEELSLTLEETEADEVVDPVFKEPEPDEDAGELLDLDWSDEPEPPVEPEPEPEAPIEVRDDIPAPLGDWDLGDDTPDEAKQIDAIGSWDLGPEKPAQPKPKGFDWDFGDGSPAADFDPFG